MYIMYLNVNREGKLHCKLFIINAASLLYITAVLGLHSCPDTVAFVLLPARFVVLRAPFFIRHMQSFIIRDTSVVCMLMSKLHLDCVFIYTV